MLRKSVMYYYCSATRMADCVIGVCDGVSATEEDMIVVDFDTVSSFVVCLLDAGNIDFVS